MRPWSTPASVGYQGLNNLGVGRISPTNGVGGFVFSAASDSFNLLVRALPVQSRLDVLSRPQIMTLDNQTSLINVGKEIPIVTRDHGHGDGSGHAKHRPPPGGRHFAGDAQDRA